MSSTPLLMLSVVFGVVAEGAEKIESSPTKICRYHTEAADCTG